MKYNIIVIVLVILLSLSGIAASAQQNYLDSGFGENGISLSPSFIPAAMAVQADGKILVTGSPYTGVLAKLYRFNADGTPDQDFGELGMVTTGNFNTYSGVRVLEDNKILLVGTRTINAMGSITGSIVFAKFNSDGTPDASFGINGILNISDFVQQSDQQRIASATKVKFLADGTIVCAGRIGRSVLNPLGNGPMYVTSTGPLVARFNQDLTLDTTFAGTGYVKMPNSVASQFNALDVYPDGSIVAGLQSGDNIRLYKYQPDGDADTTFGTEGMQVIDIGTSNDWIRDIKILSDGKILISGSKAGNSRDAFIALVNADGTFDTTYGSGGILAFTNDSGQPEVAMQSLQLDNGTVLTGLQKWGSNFDFGCVFTTTTGTIDYPAANDGWLSAPIGGNEKLTCMIGQPDGKIVVAGNDENNMILVRYDISGMLSIASQERSKLLLYPNPAVERVTVSGLPENAFIELFNVSGQKLMEAQGNGKIPVDVSGFASGVYFVKTGGVKVKFIKR